MLAGPSQQCGVARIPQGQLMRHFMLASSALLIVACGGAAIPQEQLTAAKAAVTGAQVAGAPGEPKAALHLKLAQEQIVKAEALIAEDENEEAARIIDRAQVDAELSLSLAKEATAKKEATDTIEQLQRLKKETQ
jgi:hypothetical protein